MKTVNLQLSKELKEAGYPQKGVMYWGAGDGKCHPANYGNEEDLSQYEGIDFCASPTADEK